VTALAHVGGRLGAGDRSATLERWFAPVLPRALDCRHDNALFGEVFWREASRRFPRERDGGETDSSLIDEVGVRRDGGPSGRLSSCADRSSYAASLGTRILQSSA
jgi:hypothetical protein